MNPMTDMSIKKQVMILLIVLLTPVLLMNGYANHRANGIIQKQVTNAYVELIRQNYAVINRDIDSIQKITTTIVLNHLTQNMRFDPDASIVELARKKEAMDLALANYSLGETMGVPVSYSLFVIYPQEYRDHYTFATDYKRSTTGQGVFFVSDEELEGCKGLSELLKNTGLDISQTYTAHNGFEALDYLRLENIDLLITDIQMDGMNGIELMQQAKTIKPNLPTIVISAHEDFSYAQLAIRLGAKDYHLKPINSALFLDTVRNVLLKVSRETNPDADAFISKLKEDFVMPEPLPHSNALLNDILAQKKDAITISHEVKRLHERYGIRLQGPYFSVLKISLNFARKRISSRDKDVLRYAALNIVCENLSAEQWQPVPFYSPNYGLTIILQWSEDTYADPLDQSGHDT